MARPDIVKGTYVDIAIGNGADPEVFSILCGITTRQLTERANTRDRFTRDCADPEDVPIRSIIATGKQWDITGSGLFNRSQRAVLDTCVGHIKNYRFIVSEPETDEISDGYYAGAAMMTDKVIGGADADDVTLSTTIASDGVWVWVDAA